MASQSVIQAFAVVNQKGQVKWDCYGLVRKSSMPMFGMKCHPLVLEDFIRALMHSKERSNNDRYEETVQGFLHFSSYR